MKTKTRQPRSNSVLHPSLFIFHSVSAFTLSELLVVIALIVLSLALAVPAFNSITGNRSTESATNQVSAALGRARMEAIGLQKPTGILFTKDGSGRVAMMMVTVVGTVQDQTESSERTGNNYSLIDAVPDRDTVILPSGVNVQTVDEAALSPSNDERVDDGYLGFNALKQRGAGPNLSQENIKYGGLILFDGLGRLSSVPYAFRLGEDPDGPDKPLKLQPTALGKFFKVSNNIDEKPLFFKKAPAANGGQAKPLKSQIGFVLFDGASFSNRFGANGRDADEDFQLNEGKTYKESNDSDEKSEERWIDDNAIPILINRYSGALVRGA